MSELFLQTVNMSISAGWLVLVVLLLRFIMKKAPKWTHILLWGVVAVRLICPIQLESVLSLIPSAQTVTSDIMLARHPEINTGVPIVNAVVNPILSASFTPDPLTSINPLQFWIPVFAILWLLGITALLIYAFASYWAIKRKVRTAVLLRDNLYQSKHVRTPFVLGILKPRIYLPYHLDSRDIAHVIAHEQAHIQRKDHLWKPLGFLILSLHWFNPLIWLAYLLLCRDIELACDEKVVAQFSQEQRADYSQALLNCSVPHRTIAACPLAFGEVGVKGRVKSVLHYKKPGFWIVLTAVLATAVTALCFLTNPPDTTRLDPALDVLIEQTVAQHYASEDTKSRFVAVDYDVLQSDVWLNDTTVYLWVTYQEYSYDGAPKLEMAAHNPASISVSKTKTGYILMDYWTPRDGSFFAPDIREHFPKALWSTALDGANYMQAHSAACLKKAQEHFTSQANIGGADGPEEVLLNLVNSDISVSYVGWNGGFSGGLNAHKLQYSNALHLPIYKLDTLQDLSQFKKLSKLSLDAQKDNLPSFNQAAAKYDDAFFQNHSLILVYVPSGSGSFRYSVSRIYYTESSFCVYVEEERPEVGTADMSGWLFRIAVEDALLEKCAEFDAVLVNPIGMDWGSSDDGNTVYEVTPENTQNQDGFHITKRHHQDRNGQWVCNGYTYAYRLEIAGKLPNSDQSITYLILSNTKDISFDQAWKASGLSSHSQDYFSAYEAMIVGHKYFS